MKAEPPADRTDVPTSQGQSKVGLQIDVLERYRAAAENAQPGLGCSCNYDSDLLAALPREIIEKDYGCGDPSRFVRPGDRVLDLGCGAGKICYMIAQMAGPDGLVTGVDFNDAMLAIARRYRREMAETLGYLNVRFVKGRIQDLALDLDHAQRWLVDNPITSSEGVWAYEDHCEQLRRTSPMIPDNSVDLVVSNCVLNLVRPADKPLLFREIHRVLARGGRAVISDVTSDEDPTEEMMADPTLWSDCISGAFREDRFLDMFAAAGLYGIEIIERSDEPWRVVDGIEFRSMTVRAFKGKEGPCIERNQAVIYTGPWSCVGDDDGHTLVRGRRMAVCDKTFRIMTNPQGPYAEDVIGIEPREAVAPADAAPFDCNTPALRDPRQTKGLDYDETRASDNPSCCGPDGCC